MKKGINRLRELDALRGLAAVLVVLFHLTMGRVEYNSILKLGTTGVDLFFIISGFVIFMSLEKKPTGIRFIINRVSRLYPAYWFSVTFSSIVFLVMYNNGVYYDDFGIKYLGNLTMFQFYLDFPHRILDIEGVYWTLIIEMIFYIFMFFLFRIKLLKYMNFISVFTCVATVISIYFFYNLKVVREVFSWIPLLQFFPLFFAGIAFYKIYANLEYRTFNYSIIILCLSCQILLFPYSGRSFAFISWLEYGLMLVGYFSLFTLLINNRLSFIVNKTTLYFGKISYSLYLTHSLISLAFIIPFFHEELEINFWTVAILIDLPIVIGIATFITYKIEIPYSKLMREKLLATIAKAGSNSV
jgi:peptidoglycan/LPS O-acetylase OafA/YrhL